MRDIEREYYKTYVRVRDFGLENAADFPNGSAGATNFQIIATELPKVEASGALQESNIGKAATVSKKSAAVELRADMREIAETARSLAVDSPEIGALFLMPRGNSYQTLLAAATAFYNNSAESEEDLIAYGLPAAFRADLQAGITALQEATGEQNTTKDTKTGASGAVGASMKIMNQSLRRLRGIVVNVYRNNPAKLAAWASASHVQRPAKSENEETPPNP
ncbi:MAG TPA: hypothetical protein VF604_11865 [Pyrinomonadaceae bacterium]|jgi:hypothetical protein